MENNNNDIFRKIRMLYQRWQLNYFLTCGKKNYKLPEWLLPEKDNLDMAKRLIADK